MKRRTVLVLLLLLTLVVSVVFPAAAEAPEKDAILPSTLTDIPEYGGFDFTVINDNNPDFYVWQITASPYVVFSELDSLGRTGTGMACLGPETLPTQPRGVIGDIRPSGWHTVRYDDLIEDRYLYNRSHVIGYLLCGDNATPENLFTGTRYLNAGSMLRFETQVADYIAQSGNHVIYRCSPKYEGDNLVATGVQIEAYSVEDNGELHLNVFVFNIQPGIDIDYATGDSKRSSDPAETVLKTVPEQKTEPEPTKEPQSVTYILNTNTKKFHYPGCSSIRDMKEKNKQEFYGTREEAIQKGYCPCGRCHP